MKKKERQRNVRPSCAFQNAWRHIDDILRLYMLGDKTKVTVWFLKPGVRQNAPYQFSRKCCQDLIRSSRLTAAVTGTTPDSNEGCAAGPPATAFARET
jgi:hypothetical protein